ncbi:MAG TPA: hypothetical protein VMI54_29475 [Polyangiaceae bacterium]|nr:hypothetical protein [Polyangiaceae bacterium]
MSARPRDGFGLRAAFVALLLATTVGQRFGLNFGSYSLNAALPAMYGLLAVGVLAGALVISGRRLLAYGACVGLGLLATALNGAQASVPSLLLMIVMYLPFVFAFTGGAFGAEQRDFVSHAFSSVCLFCAAAGILQFYAQFMASPAWLFDFTPELPVWLRGPSGFNTVIAVGSFHKSNGFFFHEPSDFSFLMAIAWLVEWTSARRFWRLATYALALLLTYSGTGLFTLAVGLLFPLRPRTMLRALLFALVGACVFLLLGDALDLSFTLARFGEFGSERSSAYIRYVAPLRLIHDTFDAASLTAWFGHGPGTIAFAKPGYEFHDPTWAKLAYEYGAAGFVGFVTLAWLALRRSDVPAETRAALFLSWLLMGGYLLSPEHNYLALALVTFVPLGLAGARASFAAAPDMVAPLLPEVS